MLSRVYRAVLCVTVQCRAVPCATIDLERTVMHGTSRLGIPGEGYGEERVVGTRGKVHN